LPALLKLLLLPAGLLNGPLNLRKCLTSRNHNFTIA
jgi:hypothetical protein